MSVHFRKNCFNDFSVFRHVKYIADLMLVASKIIVHSVATILGMEPRRI